MLADNRATVLGQTPDGSQIDFQTNKTMFHWELLGRASVAPAASGSDVHLPLDVHHNRPTPPMDGVKNRKAVEKLVGQIQAALG